ncbi:hypothetical protein A2U01_0061254, partial [Trifolium medium]|nr:hypothetical protein [Trifolium medium]
METEDGEWTRPPTRKNRSMNQPTIHGANDNHETNINFSGGGVISSGTTQTDPREKPQ